MNLNKPLFFKKNRVRRIYTGGSQFASFFGDDSTEGFFPEEWVCSYVKALNEGSDIPDEGISVTEDGEKFDELLKNHTTEMLGEGRTELGMLTKILDSSIRLPVQCHPDKEFSRKYFSFSKKEGKEQYLVPYLMSSHPGSTLKDAVELALFLKKIGIRPEQVQDFYPTPGTVSTCMFYTGLDPYTMKEVYVAKDPHEKALQRALLQYFDPRKKELVIEALRRAGRSDLIGNSDKCLVRPSANVQQSNNRTARNGGKRYGKETGKKNNRRR